MPVINDWHGSGSNMGFGGEDSSLTIRGGAKGLEIEDYGPGGYVIFIKKDKVDWNDIHSFMKSTYTILFSFYFYLLTGNLTILWAIALASAILNFTKKTHGFTDNRNIS